MSMDIINDISFPVDVFGRGDNPDYPVARFAKEVMEVEGAPAEFVVPALLAALSTVGSRGLEVESFRGKHSRPNLYIASEGESGVGKSAVGQRVFGPLMDFDSERRQTFMEVTLPSLTAKVRLLEARLKKAERSEGSGSLSEHEFSALMKEKHALERQICGPRFLVEDCTQEALELIISQQGGVVSLISTDARKVVKNLVGRHRKGSIEDDVFVKGWSGDTFSVDRITRGSIPPVRDPCLSMYLAVQPDLFLQLFRPELVESGFFPRLLPVRSCEGFTVHASSRAYDPEVLERYAAHMRSAFSSYRACVRPFQFPMSADARTMMDAFFSEAAGLAVDDPTLAPVYRRWAEQACRIAVCIQIAFFGREAHERPLPAYFAHGAIGLMRWFGQQQRELLQTHAADAKNNLTGRLLDLVQMQPEGIALRDAWKKLGSTSAAVKAVVKEHGRLELSSVATGGRPSAIIRMKHATPGL